MIVSFDEKLCLVLDTIHVSRPHNSRKRKHSGFLVLYDGKDILHALIDDCQEVRVDADDGFMETLISFIDKQQRQEKSNLLLKCTYDNKQKSHYISHIISIREDGIIVNVERATGDVRNFKWNKLNIKCGDGILHKYHDD